MEVTIRPPLGGCMMVFAAVMSLGLYPLLRPRMERHFIARMDDTGFETRAGKRFAWQDVELIRHVVNEVKGARVSDEYLVWTSKGRSSLPVWRATHPNEALDYLIQRAPQAAWVKE